MAGLTKEQKEAKQAELEAKLRMEIEEKLRKEYEEKLKSESNLHKPKNVEDKTLKAKKIQNSVKIPLDLIVPVTSNFQGSLYFESKKTVGYSVEWEGYGSTEYMELSELVGMRNMAKRFFEDNWIIIEDTEDYSAYEIYQFLQVDKYYKNVLTPDNIDELFNKEPNEVIKIISGLSKGMKDIVTTKAKILYDNKLLDSNRMIEALETALGVTFNI